MLDHTIVVSRKLKCSELFARSSSGISEEEYARSHIFHNSILRISTAVRACITGFLILIYLVTGTAHSTVIGADGGITIWVSYDNLDALGTSIDDDVTQVDDTGSASCTFTNTARNSLGAPDSPGSCPAGGGDTCSGRDKLLGDIDSLAEYIYTSTHGTHYLRRVYVADSGRAWDTADVKWNVGSGSSSAWPEGWKDVDLPINLNSASRKCIHDVVHHEFGHYFYNLPDRYARTGDYYRGSFDDGVTVFDVDVDEGDPNSVMASNFPHLFVDTTNARLVLSYDQPGPGSTTGEVLTPGLLTDGDVNNDGPDRAHHGFTTPFAQDEWSVIPAEHVDLIGAHTEGDFSEPALGGMPAVDVRFIGVDEPFPGTVLLLDRSGSMSVQTNGVPASQYVQEAGLYLYHSSEDTDFVGTFLYNDAVEKLFDYELYDPANQLTTANFRNASGLTNIALALEEALDAMVAEHGEGGVNSGQIILMSDGRQTTGDSLWDQVDRATGLGVQIHTMTFGNADTTTMQQIADNSGGSVTPMSELDSAAELKLNMARKITTLRGNSAIYTYKGRLTPTGETERQEYFEAEFDVPPRSTDLLFYVFLERRNAADLDITLADKTGQQTVVTPQSLERRGRFNGTRVTAPTRGKWKFRLTGGKRFKGRLPKDDNIEIVAYAQNRELSGVSWFDDRIEGYPERRIINGRLSFRYPLTNLGVKAHIYDGARLIKSIPMYDDGKQGADPYPLDGIYSGVLDIGDLKLSDRDSKRPRKIRVDVEYSVTKKTIPAPNAHYESGTEYDALVKNYRSLGVEKFTAYSTQTTHVRPGKKRDPSIRLVYPRKPFIVQPGSKGTIRIRVADARPSADQVRVSLGNGVYAKATSVTSDSDGLGATIKIVYKVKKDAKAGTRKLSTQFGDIRLQLADVMTVRTSKVHLVDLPKQLLLPEGVAIAYRAPGKEGMPIHGAEFSIQPLLLRGVKAPAGFQIYEEFDGHYHAIAHRQRGDYLIADIVAGRDYIIAPALTGHLRTSLAALCRIVVEEPRRRATDIPRICSQILCVPEPFSVADLAETYGPLPGSLDPLMVLGGWYPVPRDLCEACTRPRSHPDDMPTLTLVCPTQPASECNSGQVLFNDNFEADTLGNAPSSSPAGPPPGDSISVSGDVSVVAAASQAARISRGSSPAVLEAILDSGATATDSYCIKFKGQAMDDMREPVVVTFNSNNGASAWQLVISDDEARLTSGGVQFVLLRDFTIPRSFRFDLDLGLRQFDMFVDGTQIVSNMPLLDSSFDVPSDLRFETGQCILECFPAEYTVDDVRVTKTD